MYSGNKLLWWIVQTNNPIHFFTFEFFTFLKPIKILSCLLISNHNTLSFFCPNSIQFPKSAPHSSVPTRNQPIRPATSKNHWSDYAHNIDTQLCCFSSLYKYDYSHSCNCYHNIDCDWCYITSLWWCSWCICRWCVLICWYSSISIISLCIIVACQLRLCLCLLW